MSPSAAVANSQPPIVLIHGAGGGAFEWCVWQRVLAAEGWQVHTPEWQPAAGGLAATQFEDYLQQLQRSLADLPANPVLIGASLGGLYALELAAGVAASALVLINPMPPIGPALDLLPPADGRAVIPWAETASLESTARALPDASPATWHWLWRQWRNESGAVLRTARAGRSILKPDMPCLMVVSGKDADVPQQATQGLAAHWAMETLLLPEASHVGPLLGHDAAAVAMRVHHWLRFRLS